MLDTTRALADMATQVRACRSADGLTLQELATRSGVAASTIHKVESRQMVPTVSVLLKIAKGLGRRPEELIRDEFREREEGGSEHGEAQAALASGTRRDVGVWELDLSDGRPLPALDLEPLQRAIVLVQRGGVALNAGSERLTLAAGDCVELEGVRVESTAHPSGEPARLLLIATPAGDLAQRLGAPRGAAGRG